MKCKISTPRPTIWIDVETDEEAIILEEMLKIGVEVSSTSLTQGRVGVRSIGFREKEVVHETP